MLTVIAFLLIFIKKKLKFLSVFVLIEELPLTFLICLMVMITLILCFSEKGYLLFSFLENIFPVWNSGPAFFFKHFIDDAPLSSSLRGF